MKHAPAMDLSEFALIERYFAPVAARAGSASGVLLGVGDDAALLAVPPDHELVAATDTIVAGVHFPTNTDPRAIGHRAVAVNLSDLAAMGAEPRWLLLALTLPKADEAWLAGFAAGFHALSQRHGCTLIGGDTTRGPLSITVTAMGTLPRGSALRRRGARAGDALCVSGSLGDGAAGLRFMQGEPRGFDPRVAGARDLVLAFLFPQPQVALGRALRGIATSCIDVSDGLAADLGHVLDASGVGARVDVDALPRSVAFRLAVPRAAQRELALAGGDDYELAFSCAADQVERLAAEAAASGTRITRIGTVEAGRGLRLVDGAGAPVALARAGHDHFAP
jgi:thiamine-monophosphate kinase